MRFSCQTWQNRVHSSLGDGIFTLIYALSITTPGSYVNSHDAFMMYKPIKSRPCSYKISLVHKGHLTLTFTPATDRSWVGPFYHATKADGYINNINKSHSRLTTTLSLPCRQVSQIGRDGSSPICMSLWRTRGIPRRGTTICPWCCPRGWRGPSRCTAGRLSYIPLLR